LYHKDHEGLGLWCSTLFQLYCAGWRADKVDDGGLWFAKENAWNCYLQQFKDIDSWIHLQKYRKRWSTISKNICQKELNKIGVVTEKKPTFKMKMTSNTIFIFFVKWICDVAFKYIMHFSLNFLKIRIVYLFSYYYCYIYCFCLINKKYY
jgi:hypothetical protein